MASPSSVTRGQSNNDALQGHGGELQPTTSTTAPLLGDTELHRGTRVQGGASGDPRTRGQGTTRALQGEDTKMLAPSYVPAETRLQRGTGQHASCALLLSLAGCFAAGPAEQRWGALGEG